jgi:glycerol-3-phosphate O-acyltransferase/dihydroxyacetone phosphate acyltransferase
MADEAAEAADLYPMVNWKYDLAQWFMSTLVELFFREIHPRGAWRVPKTGPILFVAAPHANQVSSFAGCTVVKVDAFLSDKKSR